MLHVQKISSLRCRPRQQDFLGNQMRSLVIAVAFLECVSGALKAGESVGVCITGLERTLLSAPVVQSYERYIVAPIHGANGTVETFVVLTDGRGAAGVAERERHASARSESEVLESVANAKGAYSAVSSRLAEDDGEMARQRDECLPTERDMANHRTTRERVVATLQQYVGIGECYKDVLERERATGRTYAWLYRIRTDLVFLDAFAPFRTAAPVGGNVYVPSMLNARDPRSMCLNDHAFACPRHLCRPLFALTELWEHKNCRRRSDLAPPCDKTPDFGRFATPRPAQCAQIPEDALADSSLSGMETFDPPAPYFLDPPVPHLASPYFFFRRYGGDRATCSSAFRTKFKGLDLLELDDPRAPRNRATSRISVNETLALNAECCGAIREVPVPYVFAKDIDGVKVLDCERIEPRHHSTAVVLGGNPFATDVAPKCRRIAAAWQAGDAALPFRARRRTRRRTRARS